jgi:hypothetical protein
MATLETIQPYVEQLFDDSEVQQQLSRAAANLRGARARAGRAKSKKQALKDRQLHHRLIEGAKAAIAAGVAIKRGPEKRKRRGRAGRLAILAVLGAAGYVATNANARQRLLDVVGTNPAATA